MLCDSKRLGFQIVEKDRGRRPPGQLADIEMRLDARGLARSLPELRIAPRIRRRTREIFEEELLSLNRFPVLMDSLVVLPWGLVAWSPPSFHRQRGPHLHS